MPTYESVCNHFCIVPAGTPLKIKCHDLPNGEPWYFHAQAWRTPDGEPDDVVLSRDFEDDGLVDINLSSERGVCYIEIDMWRPKKAAPGEVMEAYQAHLECLNIASTAGTPMHAYLRIFPDRLHATWLITAFVEEA